MLRTRVALIVGSVAAALSAIVVAQRRDFTPVTDAMIGNPSPNDWLAWRGTSKSLGYSPLDQINRANVGRLQLAWAWAMEPGQQEAAPIVHDGVIYLPNPGGVVQALDGASGDLLWEYRPPAPANGQRRPGGAARGLSIYDDKVFVSAPDAHLVALDARTGKTVWDVQVAKGFSLGAGSIVAGGRVISGLSGCTKFVEEKCAIVAHDAATGRELWRTLTIPKNGEPGSETWGDVPFLFRAGTEMWISGSYDPALNLIYWSTSQAKPWTRAARGTEGDALYSNTTLALDPATGKIVWYRQTLPGETWDFDEVFESVLVDVGARQSLFHMGKIGVLWEMDRRTGKILHATDLGFQTVVDVDPASGAVTLRPGMNPKLNVPLDACPSSIGIKNWPSMAYSPETQALYIPHMMACAKVAYVDVEKVPGGGGTGVVSGQDYLHPTSGGNLGALTAMSIDGKVLWQHRQHAPFTTAALTTAGGLVFVADYDRYIHAYDAKSGASLWQSRAPTSGEGFPVTYAVGGRQYVAVPVGTGASIFVKSPYHDVATIPSPKLTWPRDGNALLVYALPQSPASR